MKSQKITLPDYDRSQITQERLLPENVHIAIDHSININSNSLLTKN
jgi:hypothetical protein